MNVKKAIQRGAVLTEQIKQLEAELKLIKADLEDLHPGKYSHFGAELIVTASTRVTLDQALVKTYLTAGQLAAATRESQVKTLRFRSLPLAVAA
jgi:ribosomal protein L21